MMHWQIFLGVVLLNTALCFLQYGVEQIDRKRGKIAPRHSIAPQTNNRILYWEDYYTQTYGDLLCLVWIMNAFVHLVFAEQVTQWQWIIGIATGIIAVSGFLYMNLRPGHKTDWGWPAEGKISWGGFSHLPYFASLSGMSVVCLINVINGNLNGCLLWTVIAGGVAYGICVVADIKSGHFEGTKKTES